MTGFFFWIRSRQKVEGSSHTTGAWRHVKWRFPQRVGLPKHDSKRSHELFMQLCTRKLIYISRSELPISHHLTGASRVWRSMQSGAWPTSNGNLIQYYTGKSKMQARGKKNYSFRGSSSLVALGEGFGLIVELKICRFRSYYLRLCDVTSDAWLIATYIILHLVTDERSIEGKK